MTFTKALSFLSYTTLLFFFYLYEMCVTHENIINILLRNNTGLYIALPDPQ